MEIHNSMEDVVFRVIDELFKAGPTDESQKMCTCEQCRMQVACFVLNRLTPEYTLSGRGIAYSEADYQEKLQKHADIVSLVKKGWVKINAVPRPNHLLGHQGEQEEIEGPVFNFKPIMGRLFDGVSFKPVENAFIELYEGGTLVTMMDINWTNPYHLVKSNNGIFTFWPMPIKTDKAGEKRNFTLKIHAKSEGFEDITRYMEFDLTSEETPMYYLSKEEIIRLPDIYIFTK
jgi:competence protein ComFB